MSNFDTTKWFKNQYEKKAGLISEVKNLGIVTGKHKSILL